MQLARALTFAPAFASNLNLKLAIMSSSGRIRVRVRDDCGSLDLWLECGSATSGQPTAQQDQLCNGALRGRLTCLLANKAGWLLLLLLAGAEVAANERPHYH